MDKLIKHRFWILLAVVPPLVIFGYMKTNGAIQAATEERVKQLDAALGAIPDGKGPNPTFVKAEYNGLDVYNAELRKAVDAEFVKVWEDQKPRMTWPVEMAPFVPDTYRGEFAREAGITYKAEYQDQIDKLWESIEPLKEIKPGTNSGFTGKVRLDRATIPQAVFGDMLVPSEDIWNAQEDLWQLQLLFDAVRNVNRPADNAAKSTVRWVYYVALMGGDGSNILQATAGAMSGGDEMAPGMAGFGVGAMEDDKGRARGGMQAAGMRGAVQAAVAFNPAEEFGIGFEAAAGTGASAGDGDEAFPAGMAMPGMAGMGAAGMSSGGIPIRYISFDDSAKFQERGFYMSVLIDQRKISDFLVELSNSEWPIRIVRFNVGPNTGGAGARTAQPMMAGGGAAGFGTGADEMMGNLAMAMGGAAAMPNMPRLGSERAEDDALAAAPGFTGADGFGGGAAGMGMPGGMIGASPLVNGDQIGQLFTHPDLVQMDLCGVITMYRPPTPELLAAVTAAAEGATAGAAAETATEADATDAAAVDATTSDPAATTDPAAGEAAATDPSADSAFPEVPATAPAEDPAAAPSEAAPAEGAPDETTPAETAPVEAAPPDGAPAAGL